MRPPPSPEGGITIGRYHLVEKLGEGGQAVVWRAVDSLLGVERALKVLRRTPGADAIRRRLVDEARCLAQLAHPRVLQLYDLGETEQDLFIVMEIAPLGVVKRTLSRSLESTVRVGVQMLAALDAAHSVGIVHRDVKPSNVLEFPDGVVKLSDFGIAQLPKEQLTPGRAIGTPQFCAPEQLYCDGPIDHRADVYAVASTLYAMIVGRPPSMLWRAEADDAAWEPIHGPLRPILQRATQLEPERRHPSARSLAAELLAVATLSDRERDALWGLFARSDEPDPIQDALPALRDAYRAGLTTRIASLTAAADTIVGSTSGSAARTQGQQDLRRHVHQVRGSGATYGFPRLSSLAATVEDAPDDQLLRTLAPLLDEMRSVSGAWPSVDRHVLVVGASEGLGLPADVRVSSAESFSEALQATVAAWPGIIVAPLALGDDDARRFLGRLRSTPGGLAPAVVVLAANLPPAARSELLALGADAVIEPQGPLAAVTSRLFAGDPDLRKRRRLLSTLREHRSAHLQTGRPYCTAVIVVGEQGDASPQLIEDVLAARLPDRQAIAPWADDVFLAAMEDCTLGAAELILNLAVDQIAELLPEVRLGVGLLGPGDGLLPDTIAQAEDLARMAARSGEVLPREMETARSARVAVCDDDEAVRGALLAALESAGWVGVGFADGTSCLERLGELDAAALLLDVSMPGIDGFEVLARLREAEPHLPVIMLTGTSGPDAIERAFELGADDWVSKPFSPAELLPRLRRLLRRVR